MLLSNWEAIAALKIESTEIEAVKAELAIEADRYT